MTSREMFEKFFVPTMLHPDLSRRDNGDYKDAFVYTAWQAWTMSTNFHHVGGVE
jgi:hypothetical protein